MNKVGTADLVNRVVTLLRQDPASWRDSETVESQFFDFISYFVRSKSLSHERCKILLIRGRLSLPKLALWVLVSGNLSVPYYEKCNVKLSLFQRWSLFLAMRYQQREVKLLTKSNIYAPVINDIDDRLVEEMG